MVIIQIPCSIAIKSQYANDQCYINDTIYINKVVQLDSLDDAIRFHSRLRFIQSRGLFINNQFLSKINDCPKVLIDTIWDNDWAEVYKNQSK